MNRAEKPRPMAVDSSIQAISLPIHNYAGGQLDVMARDTVSCVEVALLLEIALIYHIIPQTTLPIRKNGGRKRSETMIRFENAKKNEIRSQAKALVKHVRQGTNLI